MSDIIVPVVLLALVALVFVARGIVWELRRRERGNLAYRRRTDDIVDDSLGRWIHTASGPQTGKEPHRGPYPDIERPGRGRYHI